MLQSRIQKTHRNTGSWNDGIRSVELEAVPAAYNLVITRDTDTKVNASSVVIDEGVIPGNTWICVGTVAIQAEELA